MEIPYNELRQGDCIGGMNGCRKAASTSSLPIPPSISVIPTTSISIRSISRAT